MSSKIFARSSLPFSNFPGEASDGQSALLANLNGYSRIAFAPDGRWILAVHGSGASLFETTTGKEVRRFESQTHSIGAVAFSPDNHLILARDQYNL